MSPTMYKTCARHRAAAFALLAWSPAFAQTLCHDPPAGMSCGPSGRPPKTGDGRGAARCRASWAATGYDGKTKRERAVRLAGAAGQALCRAAIRSGRSGCWGSELSLDILHRYREAICGLQLHGRHRMARQATFPPLRL
jgi:hypothetical protein